MACPASGKITLQDLVNEFGGSAPHALSEYYRNGSLVPGNNTSVPESGEISLTDFYSAVNEIIHTHSSDATNQNYATIFGSNWASTVPKRIVINSGVTIGASVGNHAMNIPSGMGGTLVIDNNGNVHGHGGASNGGTGGDAIHCASTAVTINNNSGATIKSGGGGGGQGGQGGTGGNGGAGGTGGNGRWTQYRGFTCPTNCTNGAGSWGSRWAACTCAFGISSGYFSSGTACAYTYNADIIGTWCYEYHYTTGGSGGAGGNSGGAGGAGGAGGVGQGYNQSAGSGSSGSAGAAGGAGASGASGGNSAGNGGAGGARGQGGTGGTGGAGGAFGQAGSSGGSGSAGNTGASGSSGANGNQSNGTGGSSGSSGSSGSGGSSGGAAGYYIYNRASITFNNSGSVAGN